MTKYEYVAGWTGNIDVDLLDNGAVPDGNLAGATVELVLESADGVALPLTDNTSILDATNWRIRVQPDAADFVVGTYRGRFKVTDIDSKVFYFPNSIWDSWIIRS